MQPVVVLSCRTPGILYLNGRFAGECAAEAPLILPVRPQGSLYLEHRPLARGFAGQAHRVAFTNSVLIAQSVPEGLYAVKWPGYIAELELTPVPFLRAESEFSSMDGLPVAILRKEETSLRIAGQEIVLPNGANLPDTHIALGENSCFLGPVGQMRYLACFAGDTFTPMGTVIADDIEIENDKIRALTRLVDTVDHARIEIWEEQDGNLVLADAEYAWAGGTPSWPKSAEETARAALEAGILGLYEEAEGYLAPRLRGQSLIANLVTGFDTCVPLKYALPDSRRATGLLRRESDRCAVVEPVFYEVSPMGGPQGAWALEALTREADQRNETVVHKPSKPQVYEWHL